MSQKDGCLSLILKLFGVASPKEEQSYPYQKRPLFLSKAERSFFGVLQMAVGSRYHIFPMVRLADLIMVKKGTPSWQSHFNRISSKHLDFVICEPESVSPLLGIELDDSTHQKSDRQKRDQFLEAALAEAGLPLLRIPVSRNYRPEELVERIEGILDGGDQTR